MTHPYLPEGLRFNAWGLSDAYLVEASAFAKYDADSGQWINRGFIELSGRTKTCAWGRAPGVCS